MRKGKPGNIVQQSKTEKGRFLDWHNGSKGGGRGTMGKFPAKAMTSESRAQRLVDEFEEAAGAYEGYNVRAGIAAVLIHLRATETSYGEEGWQVITSRVLNDMIEALTAPTLLERAMTGDAAAARQFLHEAGFTDERGQWLPQYQPLDETQP
jgi:hypothetical protein